MPALYILAGPNGTGKTTFHSIAVERGFISPELSFVNVDIIAQQLGGYSQENYAKAPEIYRETVRELLLFRKDFIIESNLADSRSYDWVSLVKKEGYEVILYYLSTDDVEINIARVQRRVNEGGHDIPEPIIRTRYAQSLSYLKTKIHEFDLVYLIDNTNSSFEVQSTIEKGVVVFKSPIAQNWITNVLSIIERLRR